MQSILTPGPGLLVEPVITLAVGTALIVGLAALAGRFASTAVWQRTIWQVAILGLLVLLLVALTGTASAFVRIVRANTEITRAETTSARAARPQQSPAPAAERTAADTAEQGSAVPAEVFATEQQGVLEEVEQWEYGPPADLLVDTNWAAAPALYVPWSQGEDLDTGALAFEQFPGSDQAADEERVGDCPDLRAVSVIPPLSAPTAPTSNADVSPVAVNGQGGSGRIWWPGMVWLLGTAVIAGRLLWARLLLVLFRGRQVPLSDDALGRRVAALARRLRIRRPVLVLEAAGLSAPVAFGSLRPTLALPTRFCSRFDRRQQEAMIVHELAHLSACDPAWQSLADVVCALLWWHPLSWWSRRRLRTANEAAADEASRLIPDGPHLLASCLVVLGRQLAGTSRRTRLGWLSVEGPGFQSGLGRRVERLLSLPTRSGRNPRRGVLVFTKTTLPAALVLIAVLSTAWAHPQAASVEGGTTMSVLASSWRRSLAAAAVAAVLAPISGDTLSEEVAADQPEPVVTRADLPRDLLLAQRDPDVREREGRERPEGEREFMMRQIEVLKLALHALHEAERGDAAELVERAIHARQVTLEGRRDDEAHQIRERAPAPPQLAEILGMAADLWREFDNPENAEAVARLSRELRAERDRERRPDRPPRDRERREADEPRRPEREEHIRDLKREFEELAEKAQRIERELGGLRDDQDAEARELHGVLNEIRQRRHDIERELAELTRERPRREIAEREREGIARRLNELREAFERAREAGREEEAERLRRELEEEFKREVERRAERPGPRPPHPEEREEMERRMSHIRVAVENLHAAGLHEQAERLAAEMERLVHVPPLPPHPGRPEPPHPAMPRRPEGALPPEELDRVMHELGGQIRQLQERMEEMGRQFEQAVGEMRREIEERSHHIEQRAGEVEERGARLQRELEEMAERLDDLMDRERHEDQEREKDDNP